MSQNLNGLFVAINSDKEGHFSLLAFHSIAAVAEYVVDPESSTTVKRQVIDVLQRTMDKLATSKSYASDDVEDAFMLAKESLVIARYKDNSSLTSDEQDRLTQACEYLNKCEVASPEIRSFAQNHLKRASGAMFAAPCQNYSKLFKMQLLELLSALNMRIA